MSSPKRSTSALPAYNLYGERAAVLHDRLHAESIAERSQLHGWEIRPHRHEALFQCLAIRRGQARAVLEGRHVELRGPALVTVPALAVHGFRFSPDIEGTVITVSEAHLLDLLQPHPALVAAVVRLQAWQNCKTQPAGRPRGAQAAAARELMAAAAQLLAEAHGHAAWRAAALDAALLRLCVALARVAPAPTAAPPAASERAVQHVQRLRALVEQHYRQQPTQAALAAQLGITPTQLNRVCQLVLGHTAQAVLHARLLLQAQRELAYSRLSIKQIALDLGFSDAAYFTRFFRRMAGVAPAKWRASQHGAGAAGLAAQV